MLPFIEIGHIELSTYVLNWVILFVLSTLLLRRTFGELGLDKLHSEWLMCVTAVFGIAGAKLCAMVKFIVLNPTSDLATTFRNSGFASYGLIIFGLASVVVAMHKAKLPVLAVLDASIPMMMLAVMCGRFGCFLAGDGCYGGPTDLPWGIAYPVGVSPTSARVHPTELYEILSMLPIAHILSMRFFAHRRKGFRFVLFVFLISIVRFLLEFSRSARVNETVNMNIDQVVAIILGVASGSILVFHFFPRNNQVTLPSIINQGKEI